MTWWRCVQEPESAVDDVFVPQEIRIQTAYGWFTVSACEAALYGARASVKHVWERRWSGSRESFLALEGRMIANAMRKILNSPDSLVNWANLMDLSCEIHFDARVREIVYVVPETGQTMVLQGRSYFPDRTAGNFTEAIYGR